MWEAPRLPTLYALGLSLWLGECIHVFFGNDLSVDILVANNSDHGSYD